MEETGYFKIYQGKYGTKTGNAHMKILVVIMSLSGKIFMM